MEGKHNVYTPDIEENIRYIGMFMDSLSKFTVEDGMMDKLASDLRNSLIQEMKNWGYTYLQDTDQDDSYEEEPYMHAT